MPKSKIGFYGVSFFPERDIELTVHIDFSLTNPAWPVRLCINEYPDTGNCAPDVTFYLSEQQLINLKNSVISEYEGLLRKRKERAQ